MEFLETCSQFFREWWFNLSLKEGLILVILAFALAGLFFFLLTLWKRARKLKEIKIKDAYQAEIDQVLFGFVFGQDGAEEELKKFSISGKSNLYKKVLIKSLISLHSNFTGSSTDKLEEFYVSSGLVNYSLHKLQSKKWTEVVEGIRDLAALNYQPAYDSIIQVKFTKNDLVQQEKLIARIRLRGLSELSEFRNSKAYFNDWTQSNILFSVKRFKVKNLENLQDLLDSSNESVALLVIRLIFYFRNSAQLLAIDDFEQRTGSEKLLSEINFLKRNSTVKAYSSYDRN
ncbi:MAG: hypothetical protein ACJLTB_00845 [Algoriphagus aquaeductus]|uniref:hypothetical protein n=1 Tax=Algoriphagus aquaeductus TaxID=475299 RepID=UPI003879422F